MSLHLSLDETASEHDQKHEAMGITFLAAPNAQPFIEGLTVDVQEWWGRTGLVVYSDSVGAGC